MAYCDEGEPCDASISAGPVEFSVCSEELLRSPTVVTPGNLTNVIEAAVGEIYFVDGARVVVRSSCLCWLQESEAQTRGGVVNGTTRRSAGH